MDEKEIFRRRKLIAQVLPKKTVYLTESISTIELLPTTVIMNLQSWGITFIGELVLIFGAISDDPMCEFAQWEEIKMVREALSCYEVKTIKRNEDDED